MSDPLTSLIGPAGSETKGGDVASPGTINETMKAIQQKYQSGDYQGAWEDVMSLPDEQKVAALANPNFSALIRRVATKTDNKLPSKLTPEALGVGGAAASKGGTDTAKPKHNYGEPLASQPKPQWVIAAEKQTGAEYVFDPTKPRRWSQKPKAPATDQSQGT